MNNLEVKNNISLVNLILPKNSLDKVSKELQKAGAKGIFQVSARGSILNEGGFLAKMFPPPAPEQCLVQVLVPECQNERISNIAINAGLKVKRRSQGEKCSQDIEVLIGDSMGEMMEYYSICDIAFIGGSLTENGCQNMLEAASLSKPIIFGPSVYNFEEISKQLLENDAAIQVANADALMMTITELMSNEARRNMLGANARKVFEDNQGAVKNVLRAIKPYIKA